MTDSKRVRQILIVDDTEVIRKLLKDLLESEGYSVSCASDGIEALEMIRKQQFDLVFCDIHMPRKNGFDTFKESRDIAPGLPFVMTDSLPDQLAESAQKAGAVTCITKPFDIDDIRDCVSRAEKCKVKGDDVTGSIHRRQEDKAPRS